MRIQFTPVAIALVCYLVTGSNASGYSSPRGLTSGRLFTLKYPETDWYYPDAPPRTPCAGRLLTYLEEDGGAAHAAVFLQQPGPMFPLVVWRTVEVKSRPNEFTIEAANRSSTAPARLAYSTNCAKRDVFLAKAGTKGVGFRWKVYINGNQWPPMIVAFAAAGRRCPGSPMQILGPKTVANGSSCDPPNANLRLWGDPSGNGTGTNMEWLVEPFLAYPAKLTGTRVPVGRDFTGDEKAFTAADGFGRSVAMRGNILAVGQTRGAYVFTRKPKDGWGTWRRQTLHRPKAATPYFGNSVGIGAGFVAVASTETYRFGPEKPTFNGAVYIYSAKGNWFGPPKALPKPQSASIYYAYSVAADSSTVAVTDYGLGNIFLYTRYPNGTWNKPRALLPTKSPNCCTQVALAAGTLLTTLPCNDGRNICPSIFVLNDGKWKQQALIDQHHVDMRSGLCWGMYCNALQISPSGNVVAVEDAVYTRNGTEWTLLQTLNNTYDQYGPEDVWEVGIRAISDDALVDGASMMISAPDEYLFESNVWIRETSNGTYVKKGRLVVQNLDDAHRWGWFGGTAAIDGDLIAVGEPGWDGNQYAHPVFGAVYMWSRKLM